MGLNMVSHILSDAVAVVDVFGVEELSKGFNLENRSHCLKMENAAD